MVWPLLANYPLLISCFRFVEQFEPLAFIGAAYVWNVFVYEVPQNLFEGQSVCRKMQRRKALYGFYSRIVLRLRVDMQVADGVSGPRLQRLHFVFVPEDPVRVLRRSRRILVTVAYGRHFIQPPLRPGNVEHSHNMPELQETPVFQSYRLDHGQAIHVLGVIADRPVGVFPVPYLLNRQLDRLRTDSFGQDGAEVIGESLGRNPLFIVIGQRFLTNRASKARPALRPLSGGFP